jgi:hypothetical protein
VQLAAAANFDAFCKHLTGETVNRVFAGLEADRPEVKYGCMKLLRRQGLPDQP